MNNSVIWAFAKRNPINEIWWVERQDRCTSYHVYYTGVVSLCYFSSAWKMITMLLAMGTIEMDFPFFLIHQNKDMSNNGRHPMQTPFVGQCFQLAIFFLVHISITHLINLLADENNQFSAYRRCQPKILLIKWW